MWVEYAGEIWPVPSGLLGVIAAGSLGQLPDTTGGYMQPGGGGLLPPVSVMPPPIVPVSQRPLPRAFPTLPVARRAGPRWRRKYVCEWRTVRVPGTEPPRSLFPQGGALGPPVGIEGFFD